MHAAPHIFLLLVISFVSMAIPVWSQPLHVHHQQGELYFDAVPNKVVTFDLSALDSLDALGIEILGVPRSFIPEPLADYRDPRYTSIGSLFEPDFETLAALKPDLIIVGGRSAPAYQHLSRLAPTLDLSHDFTNFLQDFRANTRILGKIFDKEAEVEERLAIIDEQLEATRKLASEAGTALVIVTSGGRISAYGPGSRIGWIHDELEFEPAIRQLRQANHGDPVSFEFLLKVDPDWLLVLDRDLAIQAGQGSARALLDNELMQQTQAWQKDRIVYLDSITWYNLISGLQATPAMIEELRAALSHE